MARRLVAGLERRGATMAAADLAEFHARMGRADLDDAIAAGVFELPPNGAGIAALMMLNILESVPARRVGHNSVDALHTMIEAKKLAYADMQRYVADPRFSEVPVGGDAEQGVRARARPRAIDPSSAQRCTSTPARCPFTPATRRTCASSIATATWCR